MKPWRTAAACVDAGAAYAMGRLFFCRRVRAHGFGLLAVLLGVCLWQFLSSVKPTRPLAVELMAPERLAALGSAPLVFAVFWMVKVRTIVPDATLWLPKSVWSVAEGVASPSAMDVPLP